MTTLQKINGLTNHALDQAIKYPEVQGIISNIPCPKDGGEVLKHFRYRGDWSGYFFRCKSCGWSMGVV